VGSAAENAEVDFFWRDRVNTWAHHFVEIFLYSFGIGKLFCVQQTVRPRTGLLWWEFWIRAGQRLRRAAAVKSLGGGAGGGAINSEALR
jgi:hypothetical protein